MLILTRYAGENLKVFKGNNLKKIELNITILEVSDDGLVRIGINADKDYKILRDEVYRQNAKEKNFEPVKDKFTKEEIIQRWGRRRKYAGVKKEENGNV